MKKTKKAITIISLIILFINCSPQKRLNRLVTKFPHLIENSLDTLKINDTVILESISYDTTRLIEYHDSTIIINNEKIFAKYIFDTITNEIHHFIECKGDTVTIIKEIPFEVEKVIYKEDNSMKQYLWIGGLILGLLLVLFILKQIKEIFF